LFAFQENKLLFFAKWTRNFDLESVYNVRSNENRQLFPKVFERLRDTFVSPPAVCSQLLTSFLISIDIFCNILAISSSHSHGYVSLFSSASSSVNGPKNMYSWAIH
jgi:hypothetical protein